MLTKLKRLIPFLRTEHATSVAFSPQHDSVEVIEIEDIKDADHSADTDEIKAFPEPPLERTSNNSVDDNI